MTVSRKRRLADADAEVQPEYHDAQPKPKRLNISSYPFHPPMKVSPSSIAIDPTLEMYKNTASSSNADLLLSGSGLGGGTGTPPDYPRQISDLDPLTQDPQLVSLSHHEPELNPSLNSYPEPWNQQFVSGGHLQGVVNRPYSSAWPRPTYSVPRPQGWHYSASEIDCSASGKYPPDSAYYTKSLASQSMFSGEYHLHSSQQSLNGKMNAMELPSEQIPYMPFPADGVSRLSKEAQCSYPEHENTVEMVCKECDTHQTFKNKSEFNKHKLRHEKPFKCDVPGCNRTEGFTTKNDLDRHKKSIHAVHSGKSYMCAAPHCAKKNKIWPRADNFRQHIHRLHAKCNVQELMDQSWERGCTMAQEDSRRRCNSLELFQQSIYEDDVTTEHDLSHLVTRQEIDNSSTVDSISNPYCQENGYSSATSQESANPYNYPGEGVGEPRDLNQGVIDPYSIVHLSDDEFIPEAPEPYPATPKSPSLPSKKKQPLIHHPDDCPDSSAWTEAQVLPKNAGGSQTWAISADVASQAIASDLSKAGYRSQQEMESVIKDSVLSLLSANKNQKRSPQDSPCREITHPEKRLECNVCHKKKKTQCDLTKHIKRHTRPYGCTFPNCARRFGSKNDWKRHENTMHYQIETWKCAELIPQDGGNRTRAKIPGTIGTTSGVQCGHLCYRRELFMEHLHEAHDLRDVQHKDYVKDQCKKRRVGRNGQCGFWCGFCKTVVQLEKTNTDAWDERFNHIDNEHFKKGDRVESWMPLAGEVPSRGSGQAEVCDPEKEAREAEDKGSDEEDSGPDAEGEGDVIVLEAGGLEEKTARAKAATAARARGRSNAAGLGRKEKLRRLWDCCKCPNAELSRDTDLMCYWEGCNHRRCDRCTVSSRVIPEDDYQNVGDASYAA